MTHKRLKEFLLSYNLFLFKISDSNEADDEYFDDKHNNALKVVELISNKLKIIFTMLLILMINCFNFVRNIPKIYFFIILGRHFDMVSELGSQYTLSNKYISKPLNGSFSMSKNILNYVGHYWS